MADHDDDPLAALAARTGINMQAVKDAYEDLMKVVDEKIALHVKAKNGHDHDADPEHYGLTYHQVTALFWDEIKTSLSQERP